jgi:DNA-binding winged helix-turn-helix (wHTH) protein/TolB-like protein
VPGNQHERYIFDEYILDLQRACLLRDGEPVSLRPKSFDALRYLIEQRGRVVGKEELVQALWPQSVVTEGSLAKCIQDVRNALQDRGHRYVKTVPRRGYIFEPPVAVAEGLAPLDDHAFGVRARTEPSLAESAQGASRGDSARFGAGATDEAEADPSTVDRRRPRFTRGAITVAAVFAALAALGGFYVVSRDRGDAPEAPAKSIAVLPLQSLSPEPGDRYFAAGIHESVLNQLAKIEGVSVVARTTMLRYGDGSKSIPQIAAELNVRNILEGSVRYADDRVLVTAQLIDSQTGCIFGPTSTTGRSPTSSRSRRTLPRGSPCRSIPSFPHANGKSSPNRRRSRPKPTRCTCAAATPGTPGPSPT